MRFVDLLCSELHHLLADLWPDTEKSLNATVLLANNEEALFA